MVLRRRAPQTESHCKVQAQSKMNVLVVEEASEIRKRLIEMLQLDGVRVSGEANTMGDAVAQGLDDAFDASVLDLQPVGGIGLEILARLKQARPALRVIVLTNLVNQQYHQASLAAGADYCLDKSREFRLVPLIPARMDRNGAQQKICSLRAACLNANHLRREQCSTQMLPVQDRMTRPRLPG